MGNRRPTISHLTVCAWCNRVLAEGVEPASHGICDACLEQLLATGGRMHDPKTAA
jgi:hypothetical protein